MSNSITGLPGYPSGNTTWQPRKIRRGSAPPNYLDGGAVIRGSLTRDATNTGYTDVVQPGKIMVKEASGGLYRNFIIGKSTAAYVDNDTTITVSAATATEIGRLIGVTGGSLNLSFIGPPSAAGTVAATDITVSGVASATTITVGDLNLNKVTDSLIALRVAGYTAGSFCLVDDDDYMKVTDENGLNINVPFMRPLIGGTVVTSQLLDWPADTSTITYLKGLLNSGVSGYGFTFVDPYL